MHEGTHIRDAILWGVSVPHTITQERMTEMNAYGLEQIFNQALNCTSPYPGLWNKGWFLRANQVDALRGLNFLGLEFR